VNDSPQNIRETARFLNALQGSEAALELMPYHRMGKAKYESLQRLYPMDNLGPPEPSYVESICQAYQSLGIRCTVSR
jgi:pyruvate formate lyase activating enzyme